MASDEPLKMPNPDGPELTMLTREHLNGLGKLL
jgi:hypothetical protein